MKYKILVLTIIVVSIVVLVATFLSSAHIAILEPKGSIAAQQRNLIVFATALSLLVVLPVYILTFSIAWKYRAQNKKATYAPHLDGNRKLEFTWWLIPCAIILVLGIVTWKTTYSLDPYKPLSSNTKPLNIQVIALEWKWLFIYPEHNIASVNKLYVPEDTPLNFKITADAPMNSFWIPQLGGQVYAMAGMTTQLHLIANEPGTYRGVSANLSGEGFADMKFTTEAIPLDTFKGWVKTAQQSPNRLTQAEYATLAIPTKDVQPIYYGSSESGLYDTVIRKYMQPGSSPQPHSLSNQSEDAMHH